MTVPDLAALREAQAWINGISDPLWPGLTESDWAQLVGRVLSIVAPLQEYVRVVEALQEADADTMGTLVREYNAARAALGLAGSPAANNGETDA